MPLRRVHAWTGTHLVCAWVALGVWTFSGTPGLPDSHSNPPARGTDEFRVGSKTYTDRQYGLMALRAARENPSMMNVLCSMLRLAKSPKAALQDFNADTTGDGQASIRNLVAAFFELPVADQDDSASAGLHV
jgi:hypothetical protein